MLNNVLDLSHHNTVASFQQAKLNGIVGVIHKATEGRTVVDSEYHGRRHRAPANGLFWGAYHFGVKGNAEQQAEHFLAAVNPTATDLLVLDFEPNGISGTMTLAEAETFVPAVKAKTGRFPGLYSGESLSARKSGKQHAHDSKKLFPVGRQVFERFPESSGGLANFHLPAIHRQQRRFTAAPSPRHRTLRPRHIQRQPRRAAKTLVGRLAIELTLY